MENKLVLLGTGTCEVRPERNSTSALIQLGDLNVGYDLGRGTALSIVKQGVKQNQLRHIVISHFHPDHSSDLIPYLQDACWSRIDPRSSDLNIYGPPGIAGLIQRMLSVYEYHSLHRIDKFALKVHEVTAPTIDIEGRTFEFTDLPGHSNHGLAFTVDGKRYALTGDSDYHDKEVQFIAGAEVAVIDYGHLKDEDAIALAVRAQPKILVLSHVYKEPDFDALRSRAKNEGFKGELQLAFDGQTFRVGRSPR